MLASRSPRISQNVMGTGVQFSRKLIVMIVGIFKEKTFVFNRPVRPVTSALNNR